RAQKRFQRAADAFRQGSDDLASVPSGLPMPAHDAALLDSARRLLPLASDATQAGLAGCDAIQVLADRPGHSLGATRRAMSGGDRERSGQDLALARMAFFDVLSRADRLQPADLALDPRVAQALDALRANAPRAQEAFDTAAEALSLAPVLLGVDAPASYLVE